MVPETEPEFYLKEAKDMLNITQRLIADGELSFPLSLFPPFHPSLINDFVFCFSQISYPPL